jgi:hypothetical protein
MNRRHSPPKPPGLPDWLDKAWDSEFDWQPAPKKSRRYDRTQEELDGRRKWLKTLQKKWAAQDKAYDAFMDEERRKFLEAVTARVAGDKRLEELKAERDAEIEKVRTYYMTELAKEIAAADKKRSEIAAAIAKRVEKSAVKAERLELLRRGVVRGKRN